MLRLKAGLFALVFLAVWLAAGPSDREGPLRFVILGDRTGGAQTGVYERVWAAAAAEKPSFAVTAGDAIQGLKDGTAEGEWRAFRDILAPYRRLPLYLTPGNHDIWSALSEELFRKYAGHPPHYSFNEGPVHFTVLDNSRSEDLSASELAFLEADLNSHAAQPWKFIVAHRPSWLISVMFRNPSFALHQIARKHKVQFILSGHVHQMIHVGFEGITYLSMPSAGGHLRGSKKYEDGWFYGYTLATVQGNAVRLEIKELKAPHGQGRITKPEEWGAAGLVSRPGRERSVASERGKAGVSAFPFFLIPASDGE